MDHSFLTWWMSEWHTPQNRISSSTSFALAGVRSNSNLFSLLKECLAAKPTALSILALEGRASAVSSVTPKDCVASGAWSVMGCLTFLEDVGDYRVTNSGRQWTTGASACALNLTIEPPASTADAWYVNGVAAPCFFIDT